MRTNHVDNKPDEWIGIFGGSFDPPHVGHVLAVQYVLLTEPISRVMVVPCAQHPFGKQHAPFEDRLAMCRIAFEMLGSRVEVLDIEGKREGASYTIDTVRELRQLYPAAGLELIIGSDITGELDRWKDWDELQKMVRIRTLDRLERNVHATEQEQADVYYLPRVSSMGLREMFTRGLDVSKRVPQGVLRYIREHGLYK